MSKTFVVLVTLGIAASMAAVGCVYQHASSHYAVGRSINEFGPNGFDGSVSKQARLPVQTFCAA
jgi:hypothetical protein